MASYPAQHEEAGVSIRGKNLKKRIGDAHWRSIGPMLKMGTWKMLRLHYRVFRPSEIARAKARLRDENRRGKLELNKGQRDLSPTITIRKCCTRSRHPKEDAAMSSSKYPTRIALRRRKFIFDGPCSFSVMAVT